MNTKQLWQALTENTITEPYFDGIFPIDALSDIKSKPRLIICNTDPSDQPGEHWVLFFFEGDNVDFFDSLGKKMNVYGDDFSNFAGRFCSHYNWTPIQTQPKGSSLCGHYCLYYAYKRCKGEKMDSIIPSMKSVQNVLKVVSDQFNICKSDSCKFQCCIAH